MKRNNNRFIMASGPHILGERNTQRVMLLVIIALMPQLIMSVYVFGMRALTLTAVCVIACVAFEYMYNLLLKKEQTVSDLSAVVTGILLAFNLPSNLPYAMAVMGCFVAIVLVKQLFGGMGKNLVNPAITARVVLLVSFTAEMTSWPVPHSHGADAVTGPTPLGVLSEGAGKMPAYTDMFIGSIGGSLGEVSALALIIGGLFLIWKKVIHPITPVCFIATVAIIAAIAGQDPLFHVLAGGVILGAFFMATDYATTPALPLGKVIFAVGCGFFTMIIRLFAGYPEGVSFAILLMNVLTPHIENLCINLQLRKEGRRYETN